MILVGNKVDREDNRKVSVEEGKHLATVMQIPFYETSALDNVNIENLFTNVVDECYDVIQKNNSWYSNNNNNNKSKINFNNSKPILLNDKQSSMFNSICGGC
eukprot:TRINITY_DN494_c0_g1_i2.p1 TRINITY_DN494_c0_g1~~TRINITY_DN494_c0_g1_i2.p1  ORF type:complete len:102 (+),score=23.75 TRINITY_DN494_c0_g1_i2:630-935(+)